jgi:hypothetical protein
MIANNYLEIILSWPILGYDPVTYLKGLRCSRGSNEAPPEYKTEAFHPKPAFSIMSIYV